jgi:hypothetical protein
MICAEPDRSSGIASGSSARDMTERFDLITVGRVRVESALGWRVPLRRGPTLS